MSRRIRTIRLISKGVPTKKMPSGKNSSIEGPTNPPSESSPLTSRKVGMSEDVISAISDVGRSRRGRQGGVLPPYQTVGGPKTASALRAGASRGLRGAGFTRKLDIADVRNAGARDG